MKNINIAGWRESSLLNMIPDEDLAYVQWMKNALEKHILPLHHLYNEIRDKNVIHYDVYSDRVINFNAGNTTMDSELIRLSEIIKNEKIKFIGHIIRYFRDKYYVNLPYPEVRCSVLYDGGDYSTENLLNHIGSYLNGNTFREKATIEIRENFTDLLARAYSKSNLPPKINRNSIIFYGILDIGKKYRSAKFIKPVESQPEYTILYGNDNLQNICRVIIHYETEKLNGCSEDIQNFNPYNFVITKYYKISGLSTIRGIKFSAKGNIKVLFSTPEKAKQFFNDLIFN